ncbi:unnamed protein product [Pocillopora meandrina]|uniref:Uncharacterized protein n=1 Tax=Pocillopora meandrina TaxID=46732 RepID=A0AAU9Y512_9CNID|nr:unnamed protein product [Pocillopora meandrina]
MVFAAYKSGLGKEGVAKFSESSLPRGNKRTATKELGRHSWKEVRQRDSGRIQQAEHRAPQKDKQYRLAQR